MSLELSMEHSSKECVPLPSCARRLTRCESSGALALWNNHEVYIYEGQRLREKPASMTADFVIHQVVLSNSSAVCVDSEGIVHTMPLKFKSGADTCVHILSRPTARGVLACHQLSGDTAVCLQRHDRLLISINRINSEFKLIKYFKIELNAEDRVKEEFHRNIILNASDGSVSRETAEKVFKTEFKSTTDKPILVLFSLDRLTIFGQMIDINSAEDSIRPLKLFTCSSEIAELQVVKTNGLKVLIALKSGTVIYLSCAGAQMETKVLHLNASIHKLIPLHEDKLMYTDGIKMWTAEHLFSEKGINFNQVFVTQPKDFIKYDNKITCITYSNLMYRFCVDSVDILLKKTSTDDGYVPIPRDLTSSKQIVEEIMKEVQRNEEILKKIKTENTLMTAVALSRENSILDKHITFATHIFEHYEDALREHTSLTLTRPLKEYFEPNTVLLLVELKTSSEFRQKFCEICSCLSNSIQLHITTMYDGISTTTTVPLQNNTLENLASLIPVSSTERVPRMDLSIQIVSPISGPVDPTQTFWTILYSKSLALHAGHFIKLDGDAFDVKINYNNPNKRPDDIVMEIAKINHGLLFDFEIPQKKNSVGEWSYYLKLPKNFQQQFSNKNLYTNTLNNRNSELLAKKFGSNEFCKSNQTVYLTVRTAKVACQVTLEDCDNVLKMSGSEVDVVFDLRQFFSGLLYDYKNGVMELIPQIHYTRIENLRRKLRDLLTAAGGADTAAILDVAQQFHKYSLGALPL